MANRLFRCVLLPAFRREAPEHQGLPLVPKDLIPDLSAVLHQSRWAIAHDAVAHVSVTWATGQVLEIAGAETRACRHTRALRVSRGGTQRRAEPRRTAAPGAPPSRTASGHGGRPSAGRSDRGRRRGAGEGPAASARTPAPRTRSGLGGSTLAGPARQGGALRALCPLRAGGPGASRILTPPPRPTVATARLSRPAPDPGSAALIQPRRSIQSKINFCVDRKAKGRGNSAGLHQRMSAASSAA